MAWDEPPKLPKVPPSAAAVAVGMHIMGSPGGGLVRDTHVPGGEF